MTTFYISPYQPESWEEETTTLIVEPNIFRDQLIARWPKAQTRIPADTTYSLLWWQLDPEPDGNALTGNLQSNKKIVSFETGPQKSFIDFVLWYRTLIPKTHALFLFNDSQEEVLELTEETRDDEIRRFAYIP